MAVICIVITIEFACPVLFNPVQPRCTGAIWAWAAGPCASSCKTRRCNVLTPLPVSLSLSQPRQLMAKNYQQLWKDVASTSNEAKAVQTLAEILLDKEGRAFISNLERDAELCIEILDRVSRHSYPLPSRRLRWFLQGLAEHNLKTTERQAFFITLSRLAAIHGRLPESMVITEKIKASDEILASGGFADIRTGTYKGHLVAVRNIKVAKQDNILRIRKVSINSIFSATWNAVTTILPQLFCKEVILWNMLSHPNVSKLVGVYGDMDKGQFITISEWMAHGNIMEFIKKNHTNRLELVRGFTAPAASFTKMSQ